MVLGAEISPAQYDSLLEEANITRGNFDLSALRWLEHRGLQEIPIILSNAPAVPFGEAVFYFRPAQDGEQHRLSWLTPTVLDDFKQVKIART